MVHRLSGLALALFLPLHFLALALALEGETSLDRFLRWTDRPMFKLAEAILVGLLAVHLLGGLRLLVIENLAWRPDQKRMSFAALVAAAVLAAAFLLRVV
jgi:fumarate reductase subunit D